MVDARGDGDGEVFNARPRMRTAGAALGCRPGARSNHPAFQQLVGRQATAEASMRIDQEFLLYPLGTEEQPDCPACGKPMTIALHEARKGDPDFATYRCQTCTRSERFVVEN